MNIFKNLESRLQKAFESTPKSFRDGEKFEREVRRLFFTKEDYELIQKSKPYKENKDDFEKASLNPDFFLRCRETGLEFWVECKYRSVNKYLQKADEIYELGKKDNKSEFDINKEINNTVRLELGNKDQFTRFKTLSRKNHVFYIVGLGFKKGELLDILLIPIRELAINSISVMDIEDFLIPNNWPVRPNHLWGSVYCLTVPKSYCIKCRKEISHNEVTPLCYDCWSRWNKNTDFFSKGSFCHICGKEKEVVSFSRPVCRSCYDHVTNLLDKEGIERQLFR